MPPEGLDVVGIALVGGEGQRAQPMSLKAPGYLRSKAALSFCGRRVIWWLVKAMSAQGISRFLIVARGKENRYQTKALVGFGEDLGVSIRYSPVRFDALNTGNADASLRDLDYWDVEDPVLVFPTDSLFEFSLPDMLELHESQGALVTVAAMDRTPAEVAGKYGAMRVAPGGGITGFVEKPSLAELLHPALGMVEGRDPQCKIVPTNAGMYLVDSRGLRKYSHDPQLATSREVELDFGKNLLPWLVRHEFPVYAYRAAATGDLGTVPDYLATTVAMLRGCFPSLTPLLGPPLDAARRIWIPPETLQFPDQVSGMTLEEKLEERLVVVEGNVRLGRYVEVGVGARLADCNIDDGVEIGEQARIRGSAVRDGARIGAGAVIEDSYVGTMSDVASTLARPTALVAGIALGDEVTVEAGTYLRGPLGIPPRTRVSKRF